MRAQLARPAQIVSATTCADFPDEINFRTQCVAVRMVISVSIGTKEAGDYGERGLAYDRAGNFYAITLEGDAEGPNDSWLIQVLRGKDALHWFAKHLSQDEPFTLELLRAIDAPEFDFMPLIAIGAKRPRIKRAKKKPAPVFAVQLEMATALVSAARQLAAAPDAVKLAAARRAVSALLQTLLAEETFRRAAQG